MDHFFRIALCACLCLGGLQATPVRPTAAQQQRTINKRDMLFSKLNLLCENVTLTSPMDVNPDCHNDALVHYSEQLILAGKDCANADFVEDSVEALQKVIRPPTNCSLTLSEHDTFGSFKSALKMFVEEFNDHRME